MSTKSNGVKLRELFGFTTQEKKVEQVVDNNSKTEQQPKTEEQVKEEKAFVAKLIDDLLKCNSTYKITKALDVSNDVYMCTMCCENSAIIELHIQGDSAVHTMHTCKACVISHIEAMTPKTDRYTGLMNKSQHTELIEKILDLGKKAKPIVMDIRDVCYCARPYKCNECNAPAIIEVTFMLDGVYTYPCMCKPCAEKYLDSLSK
jgi:hypothetical protein